ncbi:hypothetical protein F5148DRAFT_34540 [Russula earlei]|uniref:Uncharacterized protein n=1 Tax=Russula earlei TaxID=71964 RepID=A0ACC0TSS6_9AGAM|nr:hypothetical protein F5148DRAFT_34540 [Russula earlei]
MTVSSAAPAAISVLASSSPPQPHPPYRWHHQLPQPPPQPKPPWLHRRPPPQPSPPPPPSQHPLHLPASCRPHLRCQPLPCHLLFIIAAYAFVYKPMLIDHTCFTTFQLSEHCLHLPNPLSFRSRHPLPCRLAQLKKFMQSLQMNTKMYRKPKTPPPQRNKHSYHHQEFASMPGRTTISGDTLHTAFPLASPPTHAPSSTCATTTSVGDCHNAAAETRQQEQRSSHQRYGYRCLSKSLCHSLCHPLLLWGAFSTM